MDIGFYTNLQNQFDITSIYQNSYLKEDKDEQNLDEQTKFEEFDEFEIPKETD